jgi:two-component system, NarL family, response regulator DevR
MPVDSTPSVSRPPLRILVAEPRELVRRVVVGLLSAQPEWEVCGEAGSTDDTIGQITTLKPDIAVLGAELGEQNGLALIGQILDIHSTVKVLVVIGNDAEVVVRQVFQSGARGFVVQSNLTQDLISAVRDLQHSRSHFTARYAELILRDYLQTGSEKVQVLSGKARDTILLLAQELALPGMGLDRRKRPLPVSTHFAVALVAIGATAIAGYFYYSNPEHHLPMLDKLLGRPQVSISPARPTYKGSPDVKVWIDLRTALYYCPATPLYGKTARGRYSSQRDAQVNHFEPASGQACE